MYINLFLKKKSIYRGLTTDFHMPSSYPGSYVALHSPSFECKHFFFLLVFWGGEFLILIQNLFWLNSTTAAALGCAKQSSPGLPIPQQLTASQRLLSQRAEEIPPPLPYRLCFAATSIAAGTWSLGLCSKLPEVLHTVSIPKLNFPHRMGYSDNSLFSLVSYRNKY